LADAPHGLGQTPGDLPVVVLDKHGVVQPEAVITPASRADSVLFKSAQSRRGFSGANNLCTIGTDRLDDTTRCSGDAAEPPKKIQRRPLGGENRTGRSANRSEDLPGIRIPAIGDEELGFHVRVEQAKSGSPDFETRNAPRRPRDD
jgi:hypothetical protein